MSDLEKPFSDSFASLEALRTLAETWNVSPPMRQLGARLEFNRVDRVRAVLDPVQPFHRGGMGTEAVNGAVLAGLFDLAIGTVGWLTRPETKSATVSLSMMFFKPTLGDRISVEGRLLRSGMNLIFAAAGSKQTRSSVQSSGSASAPSGPSARMVFKHQYCAVEEEREMARSA